MSLKVVAIFTDSNSKNWKRKRKTEAIQVVLSIEPGIYNNFNSKLFIFIHLIKIDTSTHIHHVLLYYYLEY